LHCCRFFELCKKKNCRFPHAFNYGTNEVILAINGCPKINSTVLYRLLRVVQPLKSSRGPSKVDSLQTWHRQRLTSNSSDDDCRVEVSLRLTTTQLNIDDDTLTTYLTSRGHQIDQIIYHRRNQYFSRFLVQMKSPSGMKRQYYHPHLTSVFIFIKRRTSWLQSHLIRTRTHECSSDAQ
jgi:hypothetical protein